jgi:glyceraldehyde-3-phosphate dehydrogenase (NADP+) (phosphorylating)
MAQCFNLQVFLCVRSQRVVDLAHLVASKWPGAEKTGSGDPLEDYCKTDPAAEECKVFD